MIKDRFFQTKFSVDIPDELSEDILYVSMENKLAAHLCPCGCGEKIITPLYWADPPPPGGSEKRRFFFDRFSNIEGIFIHEHLKCKSKYSITNGQFLA